MPYLTDPVMYINEKIIVTLKEVFILEITSGDVCVDGVLSRIHAVSSEFKLIYNFIRSACGRAGAKTSHQETKQCD